MSFFDRITQLFKREPQQDEPLEDASPEYLQLAFYAGPVAAMDGSPAFLEQREAGSVQLLTGRLVASDAFVHHDGTFLKQFPVGTFAVTLAILLHGRDQRVAFARLQFKSCAVASWEMATTNPENDVAKLKRGEIFGFGVDSGTAAFMDHGVAVALMNGKHYETFQDELMARLDENYIHTWSWATIPVPGTSGNIAAFSSGYGDGIYATYIGFDAIGAPVCAVIDFGIVDPPKSSAGA
jgi:hypothetical protein